MSDAEIQIATSGDCCEARSGLRRRSDAQTQMVTSGECCSDPSVISVKYDALSTCEDGSACFKVENIFGDSPAPIPLDTPESSALELGRKLFAETLGTAILLTVIVGSGIMAETLSPDDVGLQLLENAIAVGLGLVCLILMFGPVSGAHFNPVVSMVDFLFGDMSLRDLLLYTVCQVGGGIAGALLSNAQFDLDMQMSDKARDASHLWLGEVISTVTLLLVIHSTIRTGQKEATPFAVGMWVTAGHFFTSSTIFANPAVTIARTFTRSFTGIEPSSAGPFIAFQVLGGLISYGLIRFLYPVNLSSNRRDDNLYLRVCIQNNQNQARS
jgi:glycerol uptake facilitator-like aquaporin